MRTVDKKNPSTTELLMKAIYGNQNPYEKASRAYIDHAYPHTRVCSDFVSPLFQAIHPNYLVECGSMVGGSAVTFLKIADTLNIPCELVCIDPFTGDANMWESELDGPCAYKFLQWESGIPSIYKRFLANIYYSGFSNRITPLNCTSTVGIRLLYRLYQKGKIPSVPNYIYLDSAHEPLETFAEAYTCWSFLPKGGVLFGDDWEWTAVHNDIELLASKVEVNEKQLNRVHQLIEGSTIDGKVLHLNGQWAIFK